MTVQEALSLLASAARRRRGTTPEFEQAMKAIREAIHTAEEEARADERELMWFSFREITDGAHRTVEQYGEHEGTQMAYNKGLDKAEEILDEILHPEDEPTPEPPRRAV